MQINLNIDSLKYPNKFHLFIFIKGSFPFCKTNNKLIFPNIWILSSERKDPLQLK